MLQQGQVRGADIETLAAIAIAGVLNRDEPTAEPATTEHVRPSGERLKQVAVLAINDIERANALGPGPIVFAESGLTVIYGDNASGKSGIYGF